MKKYIFYLILAVVAATGCEKNRPSEGGDDNPPVEDVKTGTVSWFPQDADADLALTITFKAGTSSKLYGYTGDVYAHLGVVDEAGVWRYVPAEWTENLPECKFDKAGDANTWSLTLAPSVREFFGSGTTPVTSLGIVIRSSDGSKKGIQEDFFIPVKDTKYKSFEPSVPENRARPAGTEFGINVTDNTTITFVLHDCDSQGAHHDYAYIVGDFNDWTLSNDGKSRMYRDDSSECWWITIGGLDPSKEYRYQYQIGDFDGRPIRMADAFCEKILDPDNDKYIPSSVYDGDMTYPEKGVGIVSVTTTAPDDYLWESEGFRADDDLVIYEMLLRDFSGTKDIDGALARLDYLQELGVNAVELMPVQEFDGNNSWGYNPCFYFALDKAYGTPAKYKKFVDECHKRGIAVILDVVYNHCTGSSPLAKIYWNASKNETAENNPYFNVSAPHPYNVFHDFNHTNAFVKELVKRSVAHMIERYHIDGFRFDLTKGFTQRLCTEATASNYDEQRISILKEYNSAVKAVKPDAIVILEHFCALSEEQELAGAGIKLWRNCNEAYCQTAMGWQEKSAFSGMYTSSAMPFGSLVSFMESHDEERTCYKQQKYGKGPLASNLELRMRQAALNAAFCLTIPGPKMIWQFGELGYDISIDYNGRTGEKPLHWDYLDVPERRALHDTYSLLLKFRKANPEFFREDASFSWKVSTSDWASGRYITCTSSGKTFMLVGNFDDSDHTLKIDMPSGGRWTNYFNTEESIVLADDLVMYTVVPKGGFKLFINF